MSIESYLERIADASERTADALEKVLSLLETGVPAPKAPSFDLPIGPLLNRDGVVSNVYGEFDARIDLNRLDMGPNTAGRVWSVLVGQSYTSTQPTTIPAIKVESFIKEGRAATAHQFGPSCQKLLDDWYAQLRELLK
jgi:hypothetical protein